MDEENSDVDAHNVEQLTTNQIKQKAQEIAKRFEKYQGRYHTTSSRCNTPLPITSADSIESIHSNSVISDTSEKVLLFRQFLENDRKLVENSKIEEQQYNNDCQSIDEKLLDVQLQNEKQQVNPAYYDDIIEAQLHEKNINALKNQVVELNDKLENCHNIINEKDILLQSKINKIESLNKSIVQKNKLHLETVDALKKRNNEIINEERIRFSQKINSLEEESDELKNNLEDFQRLCDKLKKNNNKIEKENAELHKKEICLKSEIENLNSSYENEKKLLLQHNDETSKQIINDLENKLLTLQQENDSLIKHVSLLESKAENSQEKDDLSTQLSLKESEIQRLSFENENLNKQLQSQMTEIQKTESRWVQLKDAYLKDKERMTLLDNVVEELKMNNNELISTNVKLTEDVENTIENLTALKKENSSQQEKITDLMAVIENMRGTFEKAMKEASIEYELDKKQLLKQHNEDKITLDSCTNKLTENTSKLNEVTNQLHNLIKENDSYKSQKIELESCLGKSNAQILELNNVISEFNIQSSHMIKELEFIKNENVILTEKLKGSNFDTEENKLLSERFHKQKQLLKVKVKALKESENNCFLLQQQVSSLSDEIYQLNQNSEYLTENNKQVYSVLQFCDMELQKCYELLNEIVLKLNAQDKTIYTLRHILLSLTSLFSFDYSRFEFDAGLMKNVDSFCNSFVDDNELQMYLKKLILSSIYILEHLMHLENTHKLSTVQLIARTEVEKLVSEAVERVKLSTQYEYQKQNNELLSIIENLQNDNETLKLNASNTLETKEVLTDLNGPDVDNILSLEHLDLKSIKNENDVLKQLLMHMREKCGLINISDINDLPLQNSFSEIDLFLQELNHENKLLKNQNLEYQKIIESLKEKSNESKVSSAIDDLCGEPIHASKFDFAVDSVAANADSKVLLVRYKNLKSKCKEFRAKIADLDKKIINLTNDLECANSKYKQLNDQYVNISETHEIDMTNYQSEIENLMCEKLEAYRQLNTLKERHEILQNDYDQLKSNLDEKNSVSNSDTTPSQLNEQNTALKGKLNETQHLIDLAYSRVLSEWPPVDSDSDWIVAQSRKLEKIVDAKLISPNNCSNDFDGFDLEESEVQRLQTCVQTIHELVTSILTNKCILEASSTNAVVDLITDLKSCTETFLEFISVKNSDLHLVNERHIELSQNSSNNSVPKLSSNSDKSSMAEPLVQTEETVKSSIIENEENDHFKRAIAERDRLIEFLSEKIAQLDNMNRNVDDIKLIRDKLDKALTAVHERDIRCDELTIELTRLLEERDMLQLKLSNSIRQNQFLADNKSQLGTSNSLEEKYDSKTIDDKLEELHSLEYRKDADLFTDQEQRHMSQMQLHQSHQESSSNPRVKSSNITEEASSTLSWFKDILW